MFTSIMVCSCPSEFFLCLLTVSDQFNCGSECDWSEDGFLCPAALLCFNGSPVPTTQEIYRGGVA